MSEKKNEMKKRARGKTEKPLSFTVVMGLIFYTFLFMSSSLIVGGRNEAKTLKETDVLHFS